MADKIKGITIEIDAKTDSFSKAMKELKKESNSVKTELKYVNSALKLDPTNTELVRQKQELLAKQIKVTEDNINKMKKAKADADEASKNGTEINQEEYRRLVREISAAEQELKGLKSGSKSLQSELNYVNKALKLDPKNTELLKQKQELLSKQIKETKGNIETMKKAKAEADTAMQNGTKVNQEEYRRLVREISGAEQELKSLEEQTKQTNNKLLKIAETTESIGKKSESLGKKLSVASGTAAAVLGTGITLASQFEDAFAKVLTIADTTEKSADDLKTEIKALSDETGIAAKDIADNVYNAISAGQKTGDAVNFVKNATKLAKAGFTDSASALDILTTAMNAYGLESSEVTKVSDLLIGTQNLGKTTVAELSSAMGKVIPTAKANNVELEQLCTGYAILTANGIATAESTTYMNSMLNELGKGGTKVDKILREKTGASFSELSEQGSTLGDVLQILNDYAKENNQSFGDLWGSAEAGKAGLVLLGEGADTFNSKMEEMNAQAGATDSAFDKLNTNSDKAKIAMNQLKNAASDLGESALASLQPIIEDLVSAVKSFSEWFSGLSDGTKTLIVAILGIIAMLAPALIIIGKLITSISAITKAFSALNVVMSLNPIAIVVALIAGLVAAIVVLWNKNEGFRNAVINIWNAIVKAIESAINGICSFFTQTLPNAFNKVIDFVKTNWKSLLLLLVNPIAGAVSLLYNLNPKFKAWVDSIIKAIKDKLKGMIEVGANLVTGLWKGISDKTGWIIEQIKGFTKKVLSKIKSFFGIHSPSTETEYDGKMLVQGLAQGIKKDMSAEEALKQKCQNLSSILSEFISNYKADMDSEISGYNLWLAENPNATTEQKAAIEKAINDSKIEQKQKEIAITMTALSEQEKLTGVDSAEYKNLLTSLNNAKIELIGLQAQPGRADRFSQARYDNAESKYSLWLAENADATESEKLEKQKEMLTAQYEEQGNKVQDVNDKLWEEIQISGVASEASITLMNQLNAEKQAYIELKKAIDDVNKAKADVDTSSYYSYSRYIGQYGALLKNQGVSDAEIESAARKSSGYTGDKTIQVVNNNYGVTQDTAYSVAKRTKNTLEDVAMQGVM